MGDAQRECLSTQMVMIVTFSLLGNTRSTSRQLSTKDFSRPPGPCRNPGTVRSSHPRHKRHCQVWKKGMLKKKGAGGS